MKNRKVTLAEIDALNPCAPAASFLGANWSGTLLDILKDSRVKDVDKIWTVTKLFDEKHARLFATSCARDCLHNAPVEMQKLLLATIETAERFANGLATEAELSAAESAAESAARSAAWSAAYSSARSAAYSSARSAAESAARSAAESAAYRSAWSAAWSAQVQRLISMLEQPEPQVKRAEFIKTNFKLGNQNLYKKVVVNESN